MTTFILSMLFKAMWILPLGAILCVAAAITKEVAFETGFARPWMWLVTMAVVGFAADLLLDVWKGK